MTISLIRILIVDDYKGWRHLLSTTLLKQPKFRIIGEVSDGLEAVQKAEELQPDLILLDIGLPTLNGIEAARQIRAVSPRSKILFVSENRSLDVAQEALSTGAGGYVAKSDGNELLPAVKAVLAGKRFISASLARHGLNSLPSEHNADHAYLKKIAVAPPPLQNEKIRHHEVGFYSDDRCLLDNVMQFIGAALKAGNAAIVIATESHRDSLLPRLLARDSDIGAAIEQGRYVDLDAAEALSALMLNGMPHPVRFFRMLSDLIVRAKKAAKSQHPRVAIFGECVQLLWAQGNAEAVIQFEKLGNRLAMTYGVDILCGYSLSSFQGGMGSYIFDKICAEHSAFHSL